MLNRHPPAQLNVIFGVAALGGTAGLGRVFWLVANGEHPNVFDLGGHLAAGALVGMLVASAVLIFFFQQPKKR